MIPPFWEENGGGVEGFRGIPTQGIDPHFHTYKDVQLPVGRHIPTGVKTRNELSVSLPTEVPEEIKARKEKSEKHSLDQSKRKRKFGYENYCYGDEREGSSTKGKAEQTRDCTPTRVRRNSYPSVYNLLQSISPPSSSSSVTTFPAPGTGNSGQNQHLFSPATSPPLILAFLAIGLFTISMFGVFGWRRVQYARGAGRTDLVWLGAGGIRGLGGAAMGVDDKDGCEEVKVRPKLWDLWTRSGNSEDEWNTAKRKGKRRSEYENNQKEEQGITWNNIMPVSVRIIPPPPKPNSFESNDGKKKKKHAKSKKKRSRPVSGITAETTETNAEPPTTGGAESAQVTSPPPTSSRFPLFRIPLRIHRWARKRYFRRSSAPAPTNNNPTRTSSDSVSGRGSNTEIPLSPLQRLARSENSEPWIDYRTIELPRSSSSRPSGSRSPRRSSDRPATAHASSSTSTANSNGAATTNSPVDGVTEEAEDPYLNDLDKQLEREGLERCPITGMIVEKRDGIVGDIRNGIRKRQRRKGEREGGGKKERAMVQVAVAIVMPSPSTANARTVEASPAREEPKATDNKKRKKRRKKVKRNDLLTPNVGEKDDASSPDSSRVLEAHIPTHSPGSPTPYTAISESSASLHLLPSTSSPLRPAMRRTLTSDGGSMKGLVTAPVAEGGQKTPTRARSLESRPVSAQSDGPMPHSDAQPCIESGTNPSSTANRPEEQEEPEADLESEYEEYSDSETDPETDPTPTQPILINFGSEEENRRREEAARQVVYAFGLYECQWRLSRSASRSRHQESLRAIGVQVTGGKSGVGSGSASSSGYSSGSGTGTSGSEASSGRSSGVASPREGLPNSARTRAIGSRRTS